MNAQTGVFISPGTPCRALRGPLRGPHFGSDWYNWPEPGFTWIDNLIKPAARKPHTTVPQGDHTSTPAAIEPYRWPGQNSAVASNSPWSQTHSQHKQKAEIKNNLRVLLETGCLCNSWTWILHDLYYRAVDCLFTLVMFINDGTGLWVTWRHLDLWERNQARACTHAVTAANCGTKTVASGRCWSVSCNPAQAG